jgi:uncharacterized phage protein (TIGR01671 family)
MGTMREILFRGKRLSNGEWVYGDLLHDGYDYDVAIWERGTKLVTEVVSSTVGQYTGLTANGNRIFEGDIVFAKDDLLGSPFADGIKGKVVYCETAFFIETKNVMDTQGLFNECADYEIIGNIHDNPDLLEGGVNDG